MRADSRVGGLPASARATGQRRETTRPIWGNSVLRLTWSGRGRATVAPRSIGRLVVPDMWSGAQRPQTSLFSLVRRSWEHCWATWSLRSGLGGYDFRIVPRASNVSGFNFVGLAALIVILMIVFAPLLLRRTPPPGAEDSDGGDGSGGSPRGAPPESSPPPSGIPLPDADPVGERLRDHVRTRRPSRRTRTTIRRPDRERHLR